MPVLPPLAPVTNGRAAPPKRKHDDALEPSKKQRVEPSKSDAIGAPSYPARGARKKNPGTSKPERKPKVPAPGPPPPSAGSSTPVLVQVSRQFRLLHDGVPMPVFSLDTDWTFGFKFIPRKEER